MKQKMRMPDIMESIFDVGYLLFDLIAGIVFLANAEGRTVFILYGLLAFTLGAGDAFHLVPRVQRALMGENETIKRRLGRGLQISSITMTIFYVQLMYIWKYTFEKDTIPGIIFALIWASAIIRIIICLLPQNQWCGDEGNLKLSLIRNGVFLVTGIGVIALYLDDRHGIRVIVGERFLWGNP